MSQVLLDKTATIRELKSEISELEKAASGNFTDGLEFKISQLEEEVDMQSQLLETAQSEMNDKIVELESVESLLQEETRLRNQAENDCAEARAALPGAEAAVVESEKALEHVKGLLLKTHEERTYYRNLAEAKGQTLSVMDVSQQAAKPPPPALPEITDVNNEPLEDQGLMEFNEAVAKLQPGKSWVYTKVLLLRYGDKATEIMTNFEMMKNIIHRVEVDYPHIFSRNGGTEGRTEEGPTLQNEGR